MRKTSKLPLLLVVCATHLAASARVQAQAAVPPAPFTASPAQPSPGEVTEPAQPTPGEQVVPEAAEPTAPAAYEEPMTPAPETPVIEEAPTIDEELVSEPKSKVPSYVLWAVGGASLITGAVLGVTALTAKSDFNDNPSYDAADRAEGRAIAADIALGLSAVLLVTGTVFYFSPDAADARPTAARWRVAPVLGRSNGGALTIQF
jgi:hypothetical protein